MQVASLRKLYGDVVAVDDVSFEVERGSIFCVAFGLAGDRKFEFPGEPAIGLDPESRFRFQSRSYLRRQNARGMTIVTTIRITWRRRANTVMPMCSTSRAVLWATNSRLGGLWKNGIALVEVRRTSDGGDGDLLPVVTQFGGVRLRTGHDI